MYEYHEQTGMATESDAETDSPGVLKRNAGWLLAALLAVGSLSNGLPVEGSGASAIAGIAGLVAGALVIGYIAQRYNGWTDSA